MPVCCSGHRWHTADKLEWETSDSSSDSVIGFLKRVRARACVWRKDVRILSDTGLAVSRSGLVLQVGKHLNTFSRVV